MKAAELSASILATIADLDPDRSSCWGVRVDCGVSYEPGDIASRSRIWDDGDPTDDLLDGTSALAVRASAERVSRVILGQYLPSMCATLTGAPTIALLRSEWAHVGEDPGEIVMRDAEVVAVWAA